MNNIIELQNILKRMSDLLYGGGYDDWGSSFKNLINEIATNSTETKRKILRLYGGMGSLNDIVLYKDGKLLLSDSNEFDELRSKLFVKLQDLSEGDT
ncbi:hypothetical protein LEP1GSC058_4158 [Leptospira fainei serovar Hurstbridge str. BUT 6]|uniref:DUF6966 domain-containing protein n=1 Tax=Leptospira fainei serovar Hurstbridge str. BUT 6 TaxID=1193011 RepID=S3UZ28_9LEPT|nr:hypothetical protein [Leptospira fainei]EPG73594.1 hypothetical protein LEP1GSC058_4158 [Leptospira fainei serovar Hurstbridge str. BUT 6]